MANKHNYRRWGMFVLLMILMCLPIFVFAQQAEPDSANLVPCGQKGAIECGYKEFLELITRVFDYLVMFAVPLAGAVIVVGGAIMMTAGTNASKRAQANKIIWMAVWGLIIVLASYLIVKAVFSFLVEPMIIPDSFK